MKVDTFCRTFRDRNADPNTLLYGIEIEVENVTRFPTVLHEGRSKHWQVKEDGSLRNNGREFYTYPLGYNQARRALDTFYEWKAEYGYEGNARTGIHFHLNVRPLEMEQVAAVCALYAALEPSLLTLAGEEREENIYCVPWYRDTGQAEILSKAVRQSHLADHASDYVVRTLGDCVKYTSLNLACLWQFGTIEFRAAETFANKDDTVNWMDALTAVWKAGAELGTPENVLDRCIDLDDLGQAIFSPGLYELVRTRSGGSVDRYCDNVDSLASVYALRALQPEAAEWTWIPDVAKRKGGTIGYHKRVRKSLRGAALGLDID